MLQVRGLADVPTKDNQKIPSVSMNIMLWIQRSCLCNFTYV
jgi:hypothetical protein